MFTIKIFLKHVFNFQFSLAGKGNKVPKDGFNLSWTFDESTSGKVVLVAGHGNFRCIKKL